MFNKIIIKAVLTLSLALSATGFANAALITQDILAGTDVVGSITISTIHSTDVGGGFASVNSFESFTLFGSNLLNPDDALGQFFVADFDTNNVFAGIDYLSFDLNDDWAAPDTWAFLGEVGTGTFNDVSIFNASTFAFVDYIENLSLGQPASVVPEPAAVLLFLVGFAGIATRRRIMK